MNSKLFIVITMIFLCLICSVNAMLNVTAIQVNSSVIVWEWDNGLSLTSLSVDGYTITKADLLSNQFILSDIPPNEKHTIKIYTSSDSGTNTTTTLPNDQYNIMNLLYKYWALIVGIILIVIGYFIGRSEPNLIAGIIGFIGLGIVGNEFLPQIIYVLLIVVAFITSFGD